MAHVATVRTEEEAKYRNYPCWMCINGNRTWLPAEKWRDGFCRKCERKNSKPSEFYLKKSGCSTPR